MRRRNASLRSRRNRRTNSSIETPARRASLLSQALSPASMRRTVIVELIRAGFLSTCGGVCGVPGGFSIMLTYCAVNCGGGVRSATHPVSRVRPRGWSGSVPLAEEDGGPPPPKPVPAGKELNSGGHPYRRVCSLTRKIRSSPGRGFPRGAALPSSVVRKILPVSASLCCAVSGCPASPAVI